MDRRAQQDEHTKALIYEALREQLSFRKNGHSWGQWFEKVLTPQNVLLIGLFLFHAGSWWNGTKTDLSAQQERTRVMQAQHDKIVQEMQEIRSIQKVQAEMYAAQGEQLKVAAEAAAAARKQVATVSAAQQSLVTRQEFHEAVRQQLVPRLDRIERTIPQ